MKDRKGYLYKRGNVWWVKLQIQNRVIRRSLETTDKAEADKKARALVAPVVKAGLDAFIDSLSRVSGVMAQDNTSASMLLADVWSNYLATARRPDSGESTLQLYFGQWERFRKFCESKGLMLCREVTAAVAEEYFSICLSTSGWCGGTFNKHLKLLKLVWKVLFQNVLADPFAGVSPRNYVSENWRSLDNGEVEKWAGALGALAKGPGSELSGLVRLGALSGLRLGDAVKLTLGAWDTVNNVLRVVPAKTGRRSGRVALVPVCVDLGALLRELAPGALRAGGALFPVASALYAADRAALSRILSAGARAAGLSGRVGFHSLRHTFASAARLRGVPEVVLQAALGHSSVAMSRHYVTIQPEHLRAV